MKPFYSTFRFCLSCALILSAAATMSMLTSFGNKASAQEEDRTFREFPVVKLRSLDKITARTMTFEARVGSTVKFGPLFIRIRACRKTDPIDKPEAAAFLQIWEITPEEKAEWVYSGWMFSSSPALSPMDHVIYDVWVLDCQTDQAEHKKDDELKEGEIPVTPDKADEPNGAASSQNGSEEEEASENGDN